MKPTKSADLRHLKDSEIQAQIEENERALMNMQFRLTLGQLESPAAIRTVRRDIARMRTILHERQTNLER